MANVVGTGESRTWAAWGDAGVRNARWGAERWGMGRWEAQRVWWVGERRVWGSVRGAVGGAGVLGGNVVGGVGIKVVWCFVVDVC